MPPNLETRIAKLEQAMMGSGEYEDLLSAYRDGRPLPEPTPRIRKVLELFMKHPLMQAENLG